MGATLSLERAGEVEREIREANDRLARERQVSREIRDLARRVAEWIRGLGEDPSRITLDPYLLLQLQNGGLDVASALTVEDLKEQRSRMRVGLERTRQALREILEGAPVSEDRGTKDVARWLVKSLDAPQARIARLLHTSPRTLQRWVSRKDRATPSGDEALRVRMVAKITNQLRHSFTGPGVIRWFEEPHPELKGDTPRALLEKPEYAQRLLQLAAGTRSSDAT